MKKLLLMGAMLIVAGATSYGSILAKLEGTDVPAQQPEKVAYNGSANLPLRSRGSIINPVNRVILVVKPTVSAGPDGGSLEFNFGQLTKTDTKSMTGKFTAEVFKGGSSPTAAMTPVKLTDTNMVVNLNGNGSTTGGQNQTVKRPLYSSVVTSKNPTEIGMINYTLAASNGVQGNYTYQGTLVSEVTLGTKTDGTDISSQVVAGSFLDNSTYIYVGVKDVVVP